MRNWPVLRVALVNKVLNRRLLLKYSDVWGLTVEQSLKSNPFTMELVAWAMS